MGELILIGGGARSGKSRFALRTAMARAAARGGRCTMIATAEALDDEMRERIALHRGERARSGHPFDVIEEPVEVAGRAAGVKTGALLVECLTLWVSNLLMRGEDEPSITRRVEGLMSAAAAAPHDTVVVSNEVGLSIVPEHALARRFRDIAGRLHQQLAARAAEVYLAAMGLVLRLKPAPVESLANPEIADEGR